MTKHSKLIEKLLSKPKTFKYTELVCLLNGFGYQVEERGRSSGSAVMFYNMETHDKIMFHKPHPQKELKIYIVELVIEHLKLNKLL